MKYCPQCKKEKELNEFYDCPKRGDGKRAWCIDCSLTKQRANKSYFTQYNKNRYKLDDKFRESIKSNVKKYAKSNKEKVNAHATVHMAKKKGLLVKQPCKICGELKSIAHHEDYSKKLEVIWLCHRHHSQLHLSKFNN